MPSGCSKKLFEIVAHVHPVNTLTILPAVGQVDPLVITGCEDGSLTMWTVSKPTQMTQLVQTGQFHNQNGCSVVRRSTSENEFLAGFDKGGIINMNINYKKVSWSRMDAHTSEVIAVEQHPWCPCIASSSKDNNLITIWDTRQNSLIKTYRGHNDTIKYLRYSPDGRLLASSSSNGQVKLWNLNAGKELGNFTVGFNSNLIEFHPAEYLLATCSLSNEANCISMWCLDKMQKLESTALSSSEACNYSAMSFVEANDRNCCFFSSGFALIGARPHSLDGFDSDCPDAFWTLNTEWNIVADLYRDANSTNIVAACIIDNNLSVHHANLDSMKYANIQKKEQIKLEKQNYEGVYDAVDSYLPVNSEKSLDALISEKRNDQFEHDEVMQLLQTRFNAYVNIPSSIDANVENLNEIVKSIREENDPIITCSVLQYFLDDVQIWTFDFICTICPLLPILLNNSQYFSNSTIVDTLLKCIKRILSGYGQFINDVLQRSDFGKDTLGVNPAMEERVEKCQKCRSMLYGIYCSIDGIQFNNDQHINTVDNILEIQCILGILFE